MACIIHGCPNQADHNFSVRLRRPDTTAIWAPNTGAFICDEHATQGITVAVLLTPNNTGQVETQINSPGGQPVTRVTPIVHEAQEGDLPLFDEQ